MYSKAGNKATQKYKKNNIKRIGLNYRTEDYARLKEYADKVNMPVNTFLREAIMERQEEEAKCTTK